jgi:predicted dehydrogenase
MTTERMTMTANFGEKADSPKVQAQTAVNPKIRAGIVGAGLMGLWHAHAIEKAGGEVVAFADFNIEKAERLAAKYADAKAFFDLEKMLGEQNLDVLHICSPTESHEIIAETAIRAGVHLLIEKPLAATAVQTSRLYNLAAQYNTHLCPVHQFAFQDGAAKAQNNLSKIGRLVHLEANICSAGGAGSNAEQLDQIAADILPHPLSLMQKFLKADISEVEWSGSRPASGELRISGQTQETSLSIFISMNSRPTKNSFHLFGSEGAIHLDLFHGYSVIEPGKTSRAAKILHPFDLAVRNFSAATFNLARRTVRRESAYPGLRQLIHEFYDSIKSASEPPITPLQAIAVAEVRDLLVNQATKSAAKQ